jgi:hypothetical protein
LEEDEMAGLEAKNFDSPDEVRPFEGKGQANVLEVGGKTVLRGTFEPGWKWSENLKPIAGTDTCQTRHFGYIVSGKMKVVMNDGSETTAEPGALIAIEPGHDAEVVGDEACVFVDFGEVGQYAKSG